MKAVASVGVKCVKFVQWLPTIRVHRLAIVATLYMKKCRLI